MVRGHLRDERSYEYTQEQRRAKEPRGVSTVDGAWAHLSGALLEKVQRFATTVRSERQFVHDLGNLRHMREVTRADLVDVLLQL